MSFTDNRSTRLLVFIPSPRDLPDFAAAAQELPYDRYWVKYTGYEHDPYGIGRNFFLEHKQYTHFAICPDDLIVTPAGVAMLLKDAERYPVVMGTCNVEIVDNSDPNGNLALTHNLPAGSRDGRVYDWYTKQQLKGRHERMLRVPWAGTPFAIFRRDVVELIEFRGDKRFNPQLAHSRAYDVGIAHDLAACDIPIMVDTDVYFFHNRLNDTRLHIMNGKKPRQTWYERVGEQREITMLP